MKFLASSKFYNFKFHFYKKRTYFFKFVLFFLFSVFSSLIKKVTFCGSIFSRTVYVYLFNDFSPVSPRSVGQYENNICKQSPA